MSEPIILSHPETGSGLLQVCFHWQQDRFGHSFRGTSADGQRDSECWETVQPLSDAERGAAWPLSPPLQELSRETIAGSELLLGVGRAGVAHWSVSIETLLIDGCPVLWFDYACRSSQQAQWLGSSYRCTPALASGSGMLRLICHDDTQSTTDRDGVWQIQPRQLPQRWPGTARWRFGIALG